MLNIIVNAAFASALVAAAPSTYRDEDVNPYMPKKLRGISASASAGLGGDGAKLRVRVSLEAPPKIEEGGAPEGNILRNINPTSDTSEKTPLRFDSSEELGHLDNYVGHANQALRNVTPASDIIEKIPSGFDPSEELGYLENASDGTALGHVLAVGTGFDSTEDIQMYFLDDYEAYAHWYEESVSGNLNFYTGKAIDNPTDGAHEVGDMAERLPSDEILIARDLGKEGYNSNSCGGNYPVINQSGSDFSYLVRVCYYGSSICPSTYNVPFGCWDTSQVTDMSRAFQNTYYFNEDISFWNTAKVTDFSSMFNYAYAFNQDISYWDLSVATDMRSMFASAYDFNQPVGVWDVANMINMRSLFDFVRAFNQPLDNWDVGKVQDMTYMVYGSRFNQCLSSWADKVPDNISVYNMFYDTSCSGPSTPQPDVSPWCQTIEDGCGTPVVATESPTKNPTESPTKNPTESPTKNPTESPTKNPTESPTKNPTESPTGSPTKDSVCKNNPDQFTFTADLTCEEVARAGRKLRNDLCNNLPGNIKATCPNACEFKPSEDDIDDFTFTSETSCDEIQQSASAKTLAILCDDPFGLAVECPQFCPVTNICPCIDSIVPFKVPGGGVTSCAELDNSEEKDELCKKRKIRGKCPSVCATPGCG